MKESARELKAASSAARQSAADGEARRAREDRRDAGARPRDGGAHPRHRQRRAPSLVPRTWYGMPAYAKDGKVVCFFQPASSSRRATRPSASSEATPRRRRHVADGLRADGADRRRSRRDRRAREEGGGLTAYRSTSRPMTYQIAWTGVSPMFARRCGRGRVERDRVTRPRGRAVEPDRDLEHPAHHVAPFVAGVALIGVGRR